MRHKILFFLLLCCTSSWAQQQNVSGTVKGPDGAIAKVSIREVDANHRVLNHTTTDRNGLFSFQVRDAVRTPYSSMRLATAPSRIRCLERFRSR